MPKILRTDEFSRWLKSQRDAVARAEGNPGDVAPVGEGVSELRVHHGPGYRVYFVRRGQELVVLLCGGDKNSQASDIARARKLAKELED